MAFEESTYEDETFKNLDLQGQTIDSIRFDECEFIDCNFTEAVFKSCAFKSCIFTNCDLSLVKVNYSHFKDVHIKNSKAVGIIWPAAAWGKKDDLQLFKPFEFTSSVLNYSSFSGLDLEKISIENCTAKEVDFAEANLINAKFMGTDLEGSIFRNTNLEEADFVGAKNYTIAPDLNTIKNAKFAMPEAIALLYNMEIELINEDR